MENNAQIEAPRGGEILYSAPLSQEEFVLYQFIFRSVARAEIRLLLLLFLLGLGDYRCVSGEFRLAIGYRLSCKFDTGGY